MQTASISVVAGGDRVSQIVTGAAGSVIRHRVPAAGISVDRAVGDSVFPGQSTLGLAVGGARAVHRRADELGAPR